MVAAAVGMAVPLEVVPLAVPDPLLPDPLPEFESEPEVDPEPEPEEPEGVVPDVVPFPEVIVLGAVLEVALAARALKLAKLRVALADVLFIMLDTSFQL